MAPGLSMCNKCAALLKIQVGDALLRVWRECISIIGYSICAKRRPDHDLASSIEANVTNESCSSFEFHSGWNCYLLAGC